MKKKITIGVGVLLIVLCFFISHKWSYAKTYSYDKIVPQREEGKLKIGVIGDSWVGIKDLDSILKVKAPEIGINAEFISSGYFGANSKVVYENMFKAKKEAYSSRKVIESSPQYCIVIAGVNDSFRGFGKDFYAEHMLRITQTLLYYNIKPIILEVPNFGIKESQGSRLKASIYRDRIWFFFQNEDYMDIESYREAFRQQLKKHQLQGQIVLINYNEVGANYGESPQTFRDVLHLNKLGYEKLSNVLLQKLKIEIDSQKK